MRCAAARCARQAERPRPYRAVIVAALMGATEQSAAGGRAAPPAPTLEGILDRLGVADAPAPDQRRAVAERAYDGRLTLAELTVLRRASFLPYDVDRDD